jgi:uncharacterized repeat protein (TIGR03847 family)
VESPLHDLGHALSIDAEAIGRPGQRRFRLLVRSTTTSAALWLEKEQLSAIGEALDEMDQRLQTQSPSDQPDVEPLPFPATADIDFRAGRLGLGYEEERDRFVLHAFDSAAADAVPTLRCEISRGQSRTLSRRIATVVAAGRPICPLCDTPIEPDGHVCPKSNGHRDTQIVL